MKVKTIFLICLAFIFCITCQRDDICVDPTTPLLVIRFFDINNPTVTKTVPGLRILTETALDTLQNLDTFTDRSSSLDSIAIPLRVDETNTSFLFIMDSADDENNMETGNVDVLTFTYENLDAFVSRACGFSRNYANLSTDFSEMSENWIQNIIVIDSLVTNSNQAHVQIFH